MRSEENKKLMTDINRKAYLDKRFKRKRSKNITRQKKKEWKC
jgi:hypothetical protein